MDVDDEVSGGEAAVVYTFLLLSFFFYVESYGVYIIWMQACVWI